METIVAPVNHTIIERFEKLSTREKLAHAYLFIGPRGIGKRETAQAIAKCLCSDIDTHFYEVEYGEKLKIEMVRELLGQIKLRPFNSERKVFIISNIETLTIEASNSLLKTLEEPSKDSLLILTTSVSENVIDTIKSRCHSVYFTHFSPEECKERLTKDFKVGKAEAHFLSVFTEGNVARAAALWEDKFIQRKNAWVNEFLYGRDTEQFIKVELKDKETQKLFLDVLLAWTRDAMLLKRHAENERLVHADRVEALEDYCNQFDFDQIDRAYAQILKAHQLLGDNLNIKMSLLIIREMFHG